jgi:2'-5' RNA ligase
MNAAQAISNSPSDPVNTTTGNTPVQQPYIAGSSSTDQRAPQVKIRARLDQEYVTGGNNLYQPSAYLRSLPPYIDDLSEQFGLEVYDRMLTDSKVNSSYNLWKLSVLSQDLRFIPAVSDQDAPGYDTSQDITDFCERNWQQMDTPQDAVLWSMADGAAYGNKVAELVYYYPDSGQDKDKLCLKAIKPKARGATAFVVDAYGNTVALFGLYPGFGITSLIPMGLIAITPSYSQSQGLSVAQLNKLAKSKKVQPPNLMPREKFMVYTFRPINTDPRGTSMLRAAYTPWWSKQQALQEYQRYQAQFAGPSLVGKTPEGAQSVPYTDSEGNLILDTAGNPIVLSPEEVMQQALEAFRNGTVIALPHGSEVDALEVSNTGNPFITAIEYADRQIDIAVTGQTLATGESDHQTGAATSAHADVKGQTVLYGKMSLCRTIKKDVLYNLVKYNYGEDAARKYTPDVSLTEAESSDYSTLWAGVGGLWQSGYLDVSQQPKLDAMVGLPERSQESLEDPLNQQNAQITGQQIQQGQQPGQAQNQPNQQASEATVDQDKQGKDGKQPDNQDKAEGDKQDDKSKDNKKDFANFSYTSSIVCFYPPSEIQTQIADLAKDLPGALAASDIHMTLTFLGQVADLGEKIKGAAINAVDGLAKDTTPMKANISGVGMFNTNEGSGKRALIALVDMPKLPMWREMLVEELTKADVSISNLHGFVPHITLAYVPKDFKPPVLDIPPIEINFNSVCLTWGDDKYDFAFLEEARTNE